MPDQDPSPSGHRRLNDAEARILSRAAEGDTLVQSLVGDRLWSLLQDSFTIFDEVTPRRLRKAGLITLIQPGSRIDDRADWYAVTEAGRAALKAYRGPRE